MANKNNSQNCSPGGYARISVPEDEKREGTYKRYFGGGAEKWEIRGEFQLFFLQKMGLQPHDKFLDAGCGPLRAGVHLIDFLDQGKYYGVDYNSDFIRIGQDIVSNNPALSVKKPDLRVLENFAFAKIGEQFDFVLAFSVLNHCPPTMREAFFQNLPTTLGESGRAYLTHAGWFTEACLPVGCRLKLTKSTRNTHEVSHELDLESWGWPGSESIFPILEISATEPSQ